MAQGTRSRNRASGRTTGAQARSSTRRESQPASAPRRTASRTRRGAADKLVPIKLTSRRARLPETDEGGPLGWLLEMIETGHTPLEESGSAAVAAANIPTSSLGFAAPKMAAPSSSFWRDVLLEYKRAKR